MVSTIYTDCAHCGVTFAQPDDPGRKRRFCSGRCRTAAYRARKRRQEQAEQDHQRRFYEQAREHARRQRQDQEERARRQRERARAHQPPPHAGTAGPGSSAAPVVACAPATPITTTMPRTSAPAAATRDSGPRPPQPTTPTKPRPVTPRPNSSATSTASSRQEPAEGRKHAPRLGRGCPQGPTRSLARQQAQLRPRRPVLPSRRDDHAKGRPPAGSATRPRPPGPPR
jgi:hypothetical protein